MHVVHRGSDIAFAVHVAANAMSATAAQFAAPKVEVATLQRDATPPSATSKRIAPS